MTERFAVGVVGVGSMGRNHARVYRELPGAELVGVADADDDRASEVATAYDTRALSVEELIETADAVSVAVPTSHHFGVARAAIEEGVHTLVEKPFVERPERGSELIDLADDHGVALQVGHIERFNPAIRTLDDVVPDFDVIAIDARRLGPPVERDIDVSPVMDLMIHDIDVVRSIVGGQVSVVSAARSTNEPYVTATVEFDDDVIGTFTASRTTQRKVRDLSVTAREGEVTVDYIDQSVEIHRQSFPEYVEENGDVRFRRRNIVERPTVENGEPLKAELKSFVEAAETGDTPVVTGKDGLEAVRLARRIADAAIDREAVPAEVGS